MHIYKLNDLITQIPKDNFDIRNISFNDNSMHALDLEAIWNNDTPGQYLQSIYFNQGYPDPVMEFFPFYIQLFKHTLFNTDL